MKTCCDLCGATIKDNKCDCGTWHSPEEMKEHPFKLALEHFHEMKQFTTTGDMPHLGVAFVFFRGDYVDCKEVESFIHKMKGRPYYEDKA